MGKKSQAATTANAAKAAAMKNASVKKPNKSKRSFLSQWRTPLLVCAAAASLGIFAQLKASNLDPTDMTDKTINTDMLSMLKPDDPNPHAKLSIAEIIAKGDKLPCDNRHDKNECAMFAHRGECQKNPGWMAVMCAAACNACELLDPSVRCDPKRLGMSTEPAIKPGDLKKLFEGLPERYPNHNVTFLSREPWIVSMDNFVKEEEIEALLTYAGDLRRSTDQGKVDENGYQSQVVSQTRTSENAWCIGECENHPLVKSVSRRIEELTGVPQDNYESFQVLRYNLNQYYRTHHDMSEEDNKLPSGPRILTVFVYLNDVEEGGGTNFPYTAGNLTMVPKKGSIVMWPSVTDTDVTKQEPLTFHQALPVTKGVKYGANHWIHLYNYRVPNHWGCTGAFG